MGGTSSLLQWSRDRLIAESHRTAEAWHSSEPASMEPRSFDRGKPRLVRSVRLSADASMEPRSFDRGKHPSEEKRVPEPTASMEPRSFDRGKIFRL